MCEAFISQICKAGCVNGLFLFSENSDESEKLRLGKEIYRRRRYNWMSKFRSVKSVKIFLLITQYGIEHSPRHLRVKKIITSM